MSKKKKKSKRVSPTVPFTRPHSDRVRFNKKEARRNAKKEAQEE